MQEPAWLLYAAQKRQTFYRLFANSKRRGSRYHSFIWRSYQEARDRNYAGSLNEWERLIWAAEANGKKAPAQAPT
jgi:hypothetical protein